jgi:hypothetical protein
LRKLKTLLDARDNEEAKYQRLLQDYPWVLGTQYKKIGRHTKLDDKNIPDFTGVRYDGCRDIFEIKPPFANLFLPDGDFSDAFFRYWNQAERYLNFARTEKDYLYRKGLRFENPKCYLILGFNLSDEQIIELRRKESMTPSIQILTYNDLFAYMGSTIAQLQGLRGETA